VFFLQRLQRIWTQTKGIQNRKSGQTLQPKRLASSPDWTALEREEWKMFSVPESSILTPKKEEAALAWPQLLPLCLP
jgi:hypothetical protein